MKKNEKITVAGTTFCFLIVVLAIFGIFEGRVNSNNWPLLFLILPFLLILIKHGKKAIDIVNNAPDEDVDRRNLPKEKDLRFPFSYKEK